MKCDSLFLFIPFEFDLSRNVTLPLRQSLVYKKYALSIEEEIEEIQTKTRLNFCGL